MDCLKDISCGWCNAPGKQKCMEKSLAEDGKCSPDVFIHLWKSLNVCPHDNKSNKEATFEVTGKSILDSLEDKNNNKIPIINPQIKKKLIEEFKFYEKGISQNEANLNNILSAIGNLKKELLKLDDDSHAAEDYAGVNRKVEKTEEEINKGK